MRDAPPLILPIVLIAMAILELVFQFTGAAWARAGAHLGLGAVILAAIPRLGGREAYLIALSAGLGLLLWLYDPTPWQTARRAMDQAAFLMAFVLLISLIQEAAATSQSVERLGTFLARQPGGRRFFGIFGGTMGMSVIFNMSTITLLAPLIHRAALAAPDDPLTPIRERRQLNAHLRGFAWSVVWSPTAIAPLALLGLIDGIDRGAWIAIGFGISCTMMVIGWAEDKYAFRNQTAAARGLAPVRPAALPRDALWRFLAVCAVFATLAGAIMVTSGQGVPPSLMAAAPILLVLWLVAQGTALGPRLSQIARHGLPVSAPMCVTLAGAGFIGIAGAALLPAQAVAGWLGLDALPAWAFMLGTTLAVTALSQLALSPVMMAVFFGAVLGSLPSLPATPTQTALAVATGWAVSTTISPFASGVIMLSRVTGIPGTRLTYRWNAIYTALTVTALALAYMTITALT